MSDMSELLVTEDATGLASLVESGAIPASDLVDAAIARIEQIDPHLNAVILRMFDEARQAAAGPLPHGPFRGVPFLMKDLLAEVAGVPLTESSNFLHACVPAIDSELVARFRRAGLVIIGKTNTPEFGVGATTEPRLFGPTRNPWDLSRTPGGSSGGSAAAVAARIVPMAHGNDAGGSIRIPASCCGLVGLKPSRGRVPLGPHYGDVFSGIVAEHALTRSVRDTAALLDAVAGPMPGDPYYAPPPPVPFVEAMVESPPSLRIGLQVETPLGDPVHEECAAAARRTAALLESLGHQVEETAPTYDAMGLWQSFTTLLSVGTAWAIGDWSRRLDREPSQEDFEPFVWAFAKRGREIDAAAYLLAVQDVQRHSRSIAAYFDSHDLWLTPTLGLPPVPLGNLVFEGDPIALRRKTAAFSPFTYITNATGQPAISLPMHWTPEGLPVGVQLVARYGEEALLLKVARQLEVAHPWSDRRPPGLSL